jgi:hypothetical protein
MQKFGEGLWELGLLRRNKVGGIGKRTPRSYLLAKIESDFIFLFSNFGN